MKQLNENPDVTISRNDSWSLLDVDPEERQANPVFHGQGRTFMMVYNENLQQAVGVVAKVFGVTHTAMLFDLRRQDFSKYQIKTVRGNVKAKDFLVDFREYLDKSLGEADFNKTAYFTDSVRVKAKRGEYVIFNGRVFHDAEVLAFWAPNDVKISKKIVEDAVELLGEHNRVEDYLLDIDNENEDDMAMNVENYADVSDFLKGRDRDEAPSQQAGQGHTLSPLQKMNKSTSRGLGFGASKADSRARGAGFANAAERNFAMRQEGYLSEADKTLNKPFRLPSGSKKKFGVWVKNPETGNEIMVKFGDPNLEIKRDDPGRRKNFRARHGCDTDPKAKDKTRPKYWSCQMWRDDKSVQDMLEADDPCWDGYERVPGTKKFAKGSCRPKKSKE